jgi:hypothetical protein
MAAAPPDLGASAAAAPAASVPSPPLLQATSKAISTGSAIENPNLWNLIEWSSLNG